MKNRLVVARKLLHETGSIFISIDQHELGYLLVLLDEIFGVTNKRNIITVKRSAISGAKVINPGVVNVSENIIVYSKSRSWNPNKVLVERSRDKRYSNFIENIDDNYTKWNFITVLEAFSKTTKIDKSKLKKYFGNEYNDELDSFVLANANKIVQFASMDRDSISNDAVNVMDNSLKTPDKIFYMKREGFEDYYIKGGKTICFTKIELCRKTAKLSQLNLL